MKRSQIVWDNLIPWIIGIMILVIGFIVYAILNGKMNGAADFLKNLFRFKR